MVEIVAKDCDVDVFGEAIDQTIGFRQRCAALEEQARSRRGTFVIERVERPADPEILLDIADRRTEPVGGGEEYIETIARRRANHW